MRPSDRRLLAESGPYTVESRADGRLTVTPARTGGVVTRMALARVVAEALNARIRRTPERRAEP